MVKMIKAAICLWEQSKHQTAPQQLFDHITKPIMYLTTLISLLLLACSNASPVVPRALVNTRLIHNFGPNTWNENLAVRPCESILITQTTGTELFMLDPLIPNVTPVPIHNFTNRFTALAGITETRPDVFYVAASNFSLETISAAPMSQQIWRVAFPNDSSAPAMTLPTTL